MRRLCRRFARERLRARGWGRRNGWRGCLLAHPAGLRQQVPEHARSNHQQRDAQEKDQDVLAPAARAADGIRIGQDTIDPNRIGDVLDPAISEPLGRIELLGIPGCWGRMDAFGRALSSSEA